jgi:hypothetical protein
MKPDARSRPRAQRQASRLAIDGERIDAHGAIGVLCAGVLAIARHRPWLAVVVLVAVVAAIVAVGSFPREALARLLDAL